MRRSIGIASIIFLAVLGALFIVARSRTPGPAGRIVIAAGGAEGLYQRLAESYATYLKPYGLKVEVRTGSSGTDSVNALLEAGNSNAVQAAFVEGGFVGLLAGQGGSVVEHHTRSRLLKETRSVGRLLEVPLWVFSRTADKIEAVTQLKGMKIGVGAPGSIGHRLVRRLLDMNGVTEMNSRFINIELDSYGKALLDGTVDVAFLVLPSESKTIAGLVRDDRFRLMDFTADAPTYLSLLPFLTKTAMPRGSLEFPRIPERNVTLLGTTAALIVRQDMHPALIQLLTQAVIQNPRLGFDDYGDPVPYFQAGQFPSPNDTEIELAKDARLIFKTGELPTLLRLLSLLNDKLGMPFWVTAFLNEHGGSALLLMVPIFSVLFPLARALPIPYRWFMRRRITRWYHDLKALEQSLDHPRGVTVLAEDRQEIERIDAAVRKIKVPRDFSDQFYDLRGHISLIRQRLTEMGA